MRRKATTADMAKLKEMFGLAPVLNAESESAYYEILEHLFQCRDCEGVMSAPACHRPQRVILGTETCPSVLTEQTPTVHRHSESRRIR
jgi:hypothetical protein